MFTKYADCHIEGFCRASVGRTAATHHVGSFDYTPNDDGNYLYVAVRACTGDVPNLNYDMLPSEELKTAYKSFMGSSVFLNHKNNDPEDARGAIVDAKWHDEDPDDEWVEILMEMDEDRCPKLCKLIKSGEIDTVSMGCSVRDTRCSICGNVAEFPFEYCEHVQQKGREFQGKLAYEICNGIDFFECSWVYDPADPTAHTVELLDEGKKVAKMASLELVYEDEYLGRPYRISFQDASKPYVWNVYGVTRGSGATYSEAQADAAARAFIESIPPDDGSDYQRQDGPTSDELYKDTDMEQWDIDLHESKKVAGLSRERPRFDEYRVQGVFDDGTRWCETTLWYRQWDDDEMPAAPEEWGEDVTICDDGSGTLAVIYADDQVAYFDGSAYMYPQGDAMDFDKALDDERLAHDVLVESSKYDEMISGEDVKVAQAAEVWSCSGVYSNGTIGGGGPAGGHFDNSFGNWLPNDPVETEDCYGGFTLNLNGTPVVEFDSDMEDVSEYVDGVEGRDISGVVAECVESKADEVIEFMKDWSWYVEDDERDKRHFWEQYFKDAADNSSDGGKWTAKITNMDALPDLPTSEVTAGRKSLPGLEQWQTNDDGSYSFHSGSPKLDFSVYDRGDGRWTAGCSNDYGDCMYWIVDALAVERGFDSAQECYEHLNQEFIENGHDIHIRDYY